MRIFLVAALVVFIFALIAAARSVGTFLTVDWPVWACAGFVAFVSDGVFGDRVVAEQAKRRA
jgi:hypothetical protein